MSCFRKKKETRCGRKKKESMQQWDCFPIYVLVRKHLHSKKTKKKKAAETPKMRIAEEWPSRWFLELQMRYPKLVSGSDRRWDDNQGMKFAVRGGPKGGGFNQLKQFVVIFIRTFWGKMIRISYFFQMGGWSSPTKFGKSNDISEQL